MSTFAPARSSAASRNPAADCGQHVRRPLDDGALHVVQHPTDPAQLLSPAGASRAAVHKHRQPCAVAGVLLRVVAVEHEDPAVGVRGAEHELAGDGLVVADERADQAALPPRAASSAACATPSYGRSLLTGRNGRLIAVHFCPAFTVISVTGWSMNSPSSGLSGVASGPRTEQLSEDDLGVEPHRVGHDGRRAAQLARGGGGAGRRSRRSRYRRSAHLRRGSEPASGHVALEHGGGHRRLLRERGWSAGRRR